jgi:hypothetical protein
MVRSARGMSRRSFLKAGAIAATAISMTDLLANRQLLHAHCHDQKTALDGSCRSAPSQASLTRTDHRGGACGETRTHGVRREALRCIPDAVRRNLEERSWVTWLT